MVTWKDLISMVRYRDDHATAVLIALMWQTVVDRADPGTLSNMLMNSMDAYGLASALDWAGLPPTEEMARQFVERLDKLAGPKPVW